MSLSEPCSDRVCQLLDAHRLGYLKFTHSPVFTCEDAHALVPELPGADTKNLFLCDDRKLRHVLLSVPPACCVDLKAFGRLLDLRRPRFATAERLEALLGVLPGSVSLLGLINDRAHAVEVCIDAALWSAPAILCHPLVNTQTLVLEHDVLVRFLELTGHAPRILEVPSRPVQD